MSRIKLSIIALIFLNLAPGQDVTKTGTTASKFLSIGAGSRPVGMGGAFVATADDASAMHWNVGGLAQLRRIELLVNYSEWLADIRFTYTGVAVPVGSSGTFGLDLTAMTMDEMEVTDYGYEDGTGETFQAGSYAVGMAYSQQLTDRFSIGIKGKYIGEFISQSSATGVALDIGTLFITPFKGIRFGASISNFGQKMQMTGDDLLVPSDIAPNQEGNNESVTARLSTDRFDLPLLLRVGLAKDFSFGSGMDLTLALDAMHPNDNVEYINTGIELNLINGLASLRGGLKSVYLDADTRKNETEELFTLGAGLHTRLAGNIQFKTDYAFESFARLNNIHKFTICLIF